MTIALKMKQRRADRKPSSRRMRIGGRLLILLAVPLVGLLAVTGFGVYSGIQQSGDASALKARTDMATTAFGLANELQLQRSALVEGAAISPASRARATQAAESIASDVKTMDAELQRMADTTLRWVSGANAVASSGLGGDAAISTLSPAINSVLDLATSAIDPAGAVDAAWASTSDNLARAQAASSEESDRLTLLSGADKITPIQFQVLVGLAASQRSLLDLAATSAPYEMGVRANRVGHGVVAADAARQAAFADLGEVDLDTWSSGVDSRTDDLRALQEEANTGAVNAVNDLAESSRRLLLLAAAAAILTVFITVMLLRRAIASIAKPLAALAVQAEDVARVRLPEAVKAQQDDPDSRRELPAIRAEGAAEVHEVASAFNDVQNTALRLASEQAALRVNQAEALTNLGRRNQTLLVRQLDFISSLETEETDPEFLEHLFKLDHLASRMRRNAESLLILAGSETPRRRRKPAEVSEVIRAAMSEVEDFERVRIGHLRDSTLVGPVVIDLIHLLAELVENALGFSPPNTTVEIDGGPLGQGGYQFAVIDHGVGMSDVELMAANHRLAGLDEFDGMPTRYLGQYVVAKLAAKIGVIVRLQPTTGGRGVSAIITLPATAMFGAPDRGAAARPRPGTRAAREQGPVPFAPGTAVPHVDGWIPEEHEVPDLRDAHLSDAPNQFQVEELAVDTQMTDPVADVQVADAEPADLQPERWDRVVETVLGSVLDLSDLETISPDAARTIGSSPDEPTASEPDPVLQADEPTQPQGERDLHVPADGRDDLNVSSDEVAEIFGGEISDEPARWWIAPTLTPDPAPPTPASASATAEQTRTTPPVFTADTDTPVQDWHVEPAPAAASNSPESMSSMPSGEAPPVEPVPTKPPPTERPPSSPIPEPPQPSADAADPSSPSQTASAPRSPSPSIASSFGTSVPSASSGAGSGLLRKRVPGASLAARTPDATVPPAKSVERSADEVRARLASFQAGRSRGRTIPDAGEVSAALLESDVPNTSPLGGLDDSEMSQDWRSSK